MRRLLVADLWTLPMIRQELTAYLNEAQDCGHLFVREEIRC